MTGMPLPKGPQTVLGPWTRSAAMVFKTSITAWRTRNTSSWASMCGSVIAAPPLRSGAKPILYWLPGTAIISPSWRLRDLPLPQLARASVFASSR